MTRIELVKLLEENWKEDEEVTFLYFDDSDGHRTTICHVDQDRRDIAEGHDEWLDITNGKYTWRPITSDEFRLINNTRMYNGHALTSQEIWNRHRWVDHHKTTSDIKTVLVIN